MRSPAFIWIVVGIMLALEIYVFQAIRLVMSPASHRVRMTVTVIYWFFSVAMLGCLLSLPYMDIETMPKKLRTYLFATVIGAFLSLLLASVFLAIDDIRRGVTYLMVRIFRNSASDATSNTESITRSAFLSWLGLAVGGGLFATLLYGFSNKYNYHLRKISLAFSNLPSSFKGLKIVHISDVHSGSFMNKQAVQHGIDKILNEKPDIILFTGDLVNDKATEMHDYMDVFSQLRAPMGVYSVLGNHDYGLYAHWDSQEQRLQNLESLKKVHGDLGWKLMMNENIVFEKGADKFALIGIENWGAKANFPKFGKMDLAYPGTESIPFKILMSHDPSHWDAEVKTKYPDIDLTLSGHTHGMQFGVEVPGFRWSPVQYMYKQWADLYEDGKQKLYVNRGFGFIGYPGRVGILPEITVITLT